MGVPCEPLTARQELIGELEGYGYDRVAPADWRETIGDDELMATVQKWRDDIGSPPDLLEMIAIVTEAVEAGDVYAAAHPDCETLPGVEGDRWTAAWVAMRDLSARIRRASEACDVR